MKSIFKFLNSNKLYKYSLITLIMSGFAVVVYVASVPNTFTAGTTAKSSEVNANFTYLQERSWELSGSDLYYNSGNVGIGTTSPAGKLDVNGTIYQLGGQLHADYVFEPDYNLESIKEHADFMWENKHLKPFQRQGKTPKDRR